MTLLGINVISPGSGPATWQNAQLPLIRRGKFNVGKVECPDGYATSPENVEQMVDCLAPGPNGRRTVILRSDDAKFDPAELRHEIVDRGFDDLIGKRTDVDFYLEVGNEPNLAGMDANSQAGALAAAVQARGTFGHGRLSWLAGLPTDLIGAQTVINSGATNGYDGLACHLYGNYELGDTADWPKILDLCLAQNRAVWITEAGINDPATMQATKAKRILAWMAANQHPRLVGLVVFAVGAGSNAWPQYMLDGGAADVYGARDVAQLDNAPPAKPPPVPAFPNNPTATIDVPNRGTFVVSGPFLDRFNAYGGVLTFGYPMAGVQQEGGRWVQYFQAARFEWWPENQAPWDVQRTLYGQADYTAKYGAKP